MSYNTTSNRNSEMPSNFLTVSNVEKPKGRTRRDVDFGDKNELETIDLGNNVNKNNSNGIDDPDRTNSGPTSDASTKMLATDDVEKKNRKKTGFMDDFVGDTDEDTPKAFNLYRNKKLLSQGMMDVALFSANASQLRYVLDTRNFNVISYICITLLIISIILQVLVGIALIMSTRYNVINCKQRKLAFRYGNYVIVGIFLITTVNVFIAAFGGPLTPAATPALAQLPVNPIEEKL